MEEVRVIQGSESDAGQTNKLLEMFQRLGVRYCVSTASCHRNIGYGSNKLSPFIESIEERIIVFIGGMSLAAPGIIRSLLIATDRTKTIVFGIPLDAAARSAIEDLPAGCPVITCGLNIVSVSHSITNSALAIAHIAVVMGADPVKLSVWYNMNASKKPLVPNVELDANGLIPIKK